MRRLMRGSQDSSGRSWGSSTIQLVGGSWWVGTNKRNKDKVRVLCWAWSLRILLDHKSRIEAIRDIVVDKKPEFGLRVTFGTFGREDSPLGSQLVITMPRRQLAC